MTFLSVRSYGRSFAVLQQSFAVFYKSCAVFCGPLRYLILPPCVCLDVNQGGTSCNHCTQTCNLVCTNLLMNPGHTPKNRPIWPTLWVKITAEKSGCEWAFSHQLSLTAHGMLVVSPCYHVCWYIHYVLTKILYKCCCSSQLNWICECVYFFWYSEYTMSSGFVERYVAAV